MSEFGALGTALRALSYLYWLLAIGAFAVAIYKGKDRRSKIIGATIVVAVFGFLPGKALVKQHQRDAYAKEAWAYFKKLCDEKSGEKIYKTFAGVRSVVVIKPLPPATEKDLYDQFWYGDPYSDATPWDRRAYAAAAALATPHAPVLNGQHGAAFEFVELFVSGNAKTSDAYIRVAYAHGSRDAVQEKVANPVSRFAIAWDDISTSEDRKYWVAASRLRVIDQTDNSIVAERTGYLIESGFGSRDGHRRPWLTARGPTTTCPYAHDWSDRWFLIKVLNPQSELVNGK